MIVPEWHDLFLLISVTFSLLSFFYITALIIWVTPKSMYEYRRVLFLYTFWDAAFNFVMGIVFCPRLLFPAGGAIFHGLGRDVYLLVKDLWGQDAADYVIKTCFAMVVFSVVNIVVYQDYCLVYRFSIVYPDQRFHDWMLTTRTRNMGFAFNCILSLAFSVPCFLFLTKTKDIPDLMQSFLERHPDMFDEVKPDSVLLWFDTGANKATNTSQKIRLLFIGFVVGFVVSEIVCILSVGWILKILRKNASNFSAQTYKLHRQMTLLLYLQIINPIIFIWFPIGSCILAVFLKLDFRKSTGIWGLIFMSFYSLSNAALTIGFVSPYRNFTAKYTVGIIMKLPCLKKYNNVIHIVPIESTTGNSFISRQARNAH